MSTFVITGASQGIGRDTAIALVQAGHQVQAIARNEAALKALAADLEEAPGQFHPLAFDLTASDLSPLKHRLQAAGPIHGLLNNAGLLINKAFEATSPADWQQIFAVNLFAPAQLCQLLSNQFSSGAHIVNIGSMGGFQGSSKFPGLLAYSSAKAALATFSECLAEEWKSRNIQVNCLALGAVQTDMLATAFPGYQAPLGSEDMARFICWFLQYGGQFFNGKVLPVALNNP